jgi:tRNA A-37 threonylcarbamoyl transferase component Bud32
VGEARPEIRTEVVKDRPTRLVLRHHDGQGFDRHEKRILLQNQPLRRFLVLLGRDAARREARNLLRLAELGIRAPRLVETRREPASLLPRTLVIVTGTLVGHRPIAAGEERAPGMAEALGRHLRGLHDQGVFHEDLHRGNLLVDHEGRFALLDADRVRFRPAPSRALRLTGLRTALLGFRGLADPPVLDRFLAGYGGTAHGIDRDHLLAAARNDLHRHERLRSRRALRANPDFGPCTSGALQWQVRRRVEIGDPLAMACTATLKDGRSTRVTIRDERFVLKEFRTKGLLARLGDLLRGSRARRAFRKGHLLELLGIPTARVLAYAGPRSSPSHLLCERVRPGTRLGIALREAAPGPRAALLLELGHLLGRLHGAGLSHRDLKEKNILIDEAGRCVLVDLDGLCVRGRVSDRRAGKDLDRLFRSLASEGIDLPAEEEAVLRTAYLRARGG